MDPVLYHTHHSRHSEDLPFWQQLATDQGGPILELGCGSGRVLIPLAAQGYTIVGLDHDPAMLTYLRRRLPESDRLLIVQSDLRSFAFRFQFPLIILPCNTLTTLAAPDRQALFQCVHTHLAPWGWFVASFPNPAVLAGLPPVGEPVVEEVFPHPEGSGVVKVSSAWERIVGQVKINWRYDWKRADGSVERAAMDQVHHIIQISTLATELEESGLRMEKLFGDYDGSPYEEDAPYCILVAGSKD
jgi:SAM-dependent methyltransferase